MEQFAKFLEIIGNNGLSIVISAIVIIVVVNNNKKQNKYFDTMFHKLIEKDMSIEDKIPVHDVLEDKKYDLTYKTIHDILKELREKCDSARCYVFMYHNGGQNLNGVPFQRLSCISECIAPGLKSIIRDYQACQRSMFSGLCAELIKSGNFYIENLPDIEGSHAVLHEMLQERSINSAYFSSVNDHKTNTVIGFIGIEFIENHSEEDINSCKKLLEEASVRVSGLMEVINNDTSCQS